LHLNNLEVWPEVGLLIGYWQTLNSPAGLLFPDAAENKIGEEANMNEPKKRSDKSSWVIGGMTLLGIGVGLIFLQTSALLFVASILIGIGLGIVIAAILSSRSG